MADDFVDLGSKKIALVKAKATKNTPSTSCPPGEDRDRPIRYSGAGPKRDRGRSSIPLNSFRPKRREVNVIWGKWRRSEAKSPCNH
jgi:hypothetical protein